MTDWKNIKKIFSEYLLLEKRLSKNTQLAYTRDITKLETYSLGFEISSPITIDRFFLQDFIYDFAKKTEAEKSQARLISSLKTFFKFLKLEKLRDDNPSELLESPKIKLHLPDVLSENEIEKLILAIDLSDNEGQRNRAIIEVLYGCGIRVSELTSLRLSDLFFTNGFIRVVGKGDKQRLVPISQRTIKYINLYTQSIRNHQVIQPDSSDILFLNRRGRNLTREMIFIIIKKLAKEAKINKNVSPHTFRHSFATVLLRNGANLRVIQQILGHESITTTEIYTHLDKQQLIDTINRFHPLSNS